MKKSFSHGMDLDARDRSISSASCLSTSCMYMMSESGQPGTRKAWSMIDSQIPENLRPRLPLKSFNHISKEVINLEKSKNFYCDLLGFVVVPRPPFEADGYWLWGYQLSLHLVTTKDKQARKAVLKARYQHFTDALPRVDHFAFMTDDIGNVKQILDQANVYYKHEKPAGTGIEQLFFFDPDGNVIEVSTCSANLEGINWCHRDVNEDHANSNNNISSCTPRDGIAFSTAATTTTTVISPLATPATPATPGAPGTVTPVGIDYLSSVGISQYCDLECPQPQIRNVVEFEFADGSREQVVIGEMNIGSQGDYHYNESDFSNHSTTSRESNEEDSPTNLSEEEGGDEERETETETETTPFASLRPSVDAPSLDAHSLASMRPSVEAPSFDALSLPSVPGQFSPNDSNR